MANLVSMNMILFNDDHCYMIVFITLMQLATMEIILTVFYDQYKL